MKSLIIHLPRATARAENMSRLMQMLPSPQVVEAVDGSEPAQIARITQYAGDLHDPPYPFRLSAGEVGCFLSHRRCWEMIVQGDAPYALIAEDDLKTSPRAFTAALDLAVRYADENSFIRLPAKTRERPAGPVARQGNAALFLPRTIGLQAVCQIVGRKAAQRLLDVTQVIDRPVDTTLQMHWITGQPVQTILPSGVAEVGAASTIQSKTRINDLLMREIRRATYRHQIRRKPQLA